MSNNLAQVQKNNITTNEYWQKRLLRMIVLEKSNFVFSQLGEEIDFPANEGTRTYSARRYNHLPVTNHQLSEGVAPTALKVEAHKVQGTINQYGAFIKITDWVQDIHMDDIRNIYQPELARHAAEVLERVILASFTDASEYFVGGATSKTGLTTDSVLTLKDARINALTMKNYRRKGHKSTGGLPLLVMHTNVMQDLLDDEDLKDRILVPGNENAPIKNGTLQNYKAYGIYFQETLVCPIEKVTLTQGGQQNVYSSFMLGESPYGVLKLKSLKWLKKDFTADSGDPLAQHASVGYKMWCGAKVLDPMAIIRIYSCSKYDINPDFTNDDWGAPSSQV